MNLKIDCSPLHAGQWLMNHDATVGEGKSLSLCSRREQHRSHACTLSHAIGGNIAGNELHRVVDRHAGSNGTSGAVDVHRNVGLAVLELQIEELCHDTISDIIVDSAAE